MKTKRFLTKIIKLQSIVLVLCFLTLYSCNQDPNKNVEESYTESAESPDETYIDLDSAVVGSGNPVIIDGIEAPDQQGTSIDKNHSGANPPTGGGRNPASTDGYIESVENPDHGAAPSSPTIAVESPAKSVSATEDNYKVILATSEKIFKNQTCELKIWIGAEKVEVTFSDGMITDQTTIPAAIGQYAKITPYAPEFEVSPAQMTCVKIHPSGSEVRFTLKPKSSGQFKVSANIEIYNTADCTGAAVPKTAKTLSVTVTTDRVHEIREALKEMGAVVWDKFMSFWGVVITLLFAALLFVIRRFVKKKTGYDDNAGG